MWVRSWSLGIATGTHVLESVEVAERDIEGEKKVRRES